MDMIIPDWPAPDTVGTAITTRKGGVSVTPWNELNLAYHVGDNPKLVDENWRRVAEQLQLPSEQILLEQVHGTRVVSIDSFQYRESPVADGAYTNQARRVCTVMTADCLPILLCNTEGTEVAAVHAGWRGLAAGVVDQAVQNFLSPSHQLMAYLGPAISQQHFEVGDDVKQAFLAKCSHSDAHHRVDNCLLPVRESTPCDKWWADLYELARIALNEVGITKIYGGNFCTYDDERHFFSYRRDGQTGRMASLIWIR